MSVGTRIVRSRGRGGRGRGERDASVRSRGTTWSFSEWGERETRRVAVELDQGRVLRLETC